ncbi:DUF1641 domain-containing protein [Candidatus Parcubacteria bacterium]|nr:MAG: DUF1641 domain-containing protein [Candidatus Parcubacteria bacterium]
MEPTLTLEETLAQINARLDRLATQVDFLTEEAQRQKRRQQEWDELKDDLIPIGNDIFRLTVCQLEEIQEHAQIEDILRLLKRLLRNTRNLELMLDQLESVSELLQDVGPLSRTAFLSLLNLLNEMEQKGYFVFLQGGLDIIDRIVTSFTEEDVRQLGDNIVLILNTVKQMTQPEIMQMLQQTAQVVQEEEPVDTSLLSLVRQMNDPAVRKGLAKTLQILKSVANK